VPEWASVELLRKRYGNRSWVTTLRRYVEHSHACPMAMVVSTPAWMPKPDDQVTRGRHFVGSPQFQARFAQVPPALVVQEIDRNNYERIGGLGRKFLLCLEDLNGNRHEFRAETFFNRYYLLTLLVYERGLERRRLVVGAP
jgi:hypothetical protein